MILSEQSIPGQCKVIGGNIWYQVFNAKGSNRPLLVVHGGPGTPHDYLKSLATLVPNHPIIFYDQLDCGLSNKTNKNSNWQLARFVDEIDQLSLHLGLEQFNLYAHSAGTMFAFDYAQSFPHKIKRLILASPVLSIRLYLEAMQQLLESFPSMIRQAFIQDTPDPLELMEANAFFAERHMCLLPVWPDELFDASIKTNAALRNYLWGVNDFKVTGTLKHYERVPHLSDFPVKTLITVGEHDFISPQTCRRYAQLMHDCTLEIIEDASHHGHLEQPNVYASLLQSWLIQD